MGLTLPQSLQAQLGDKIAVVETKSGDLTYATGPLQWQMERQFAVAGANDGVYVLVSDQPPGDWMWSKAEEFKETYGADYHFMNPDGVPWVRP